MTKFLVLTILVIWNHTSLECKNLMHEKVVISYDNYGKFGNNVKVEFSIKIGLKVIHYIYILKE